MKMSKSKRACLYEAIHSTVVDTRISLKLDPSKDAELAQIEHLIWKRILFVLNAQVRL